MKFDQSIQLPYFPNSSPAIRRYPMEATIALYITTILPVSAAESGPENRFEAQARRDDEADRTTPPRHGAILRAGDSRFFRGQTDREDLPCDTTPDRFLPTSRAGGDAGGSGRHHASFVRSPPDHAP